MTFEAETPLLIGELKDTLHALAVRIAVFQHAAIFPSLNPDAGLNGTPQRTLIVVAGLNAYAKGVSLGLERSSISMADAFSHRLHRLNFRPLPRTFVQQ